jgi:hypothetical protein
MPSAALRDSERFETPNLFAEARLFFIEEISGPQVLDARLFRAEFVPCNCSQRVICHGLPNLPGEMNMICFRSHNSIPSRGGRLFIRQR